MRPPGIGSHFNHAPRFAQRPWQFARRPWAARRFGAALPLAAWGYFDDDYYGAYGAYGASYSAAIYPITSAATPPASVPAQEPLADYPVGALPGPIYPRYIPVRRGCDAEQQKVPAQGNAETTITILRC
jgi:hypothetical protein